MAGRTVWLAIAVLFAAFGILDAGWSSRIPEIRAHLHLSNFALSLALTGPAIGLLAASRVAPALVGRLGNTRAARVGVTGAAVMLPLAALAPTLPLLTLALIVWGFFLGTVEILMNAAGSALEKERGRSLLSGLHGTYSGSVLVFAPIGSLAIALHISPALHFVVIGLVCAAATRVAAAHLPEIHPASVHVVDPEPERPEPATGNGGRLLALAGIGLVAIVAEAAVVSWSGLFLREEIHAAPAEAPLALLVFSLGMTAGRLTGDRTIAHFGYAGADLRAALLAAVSVLTITLSHSVLVVLVGYALLGCGLSVLIPVSFALSTRLPGVSPLRGLSRMTTAVYFGLFVGPSFVGLLAAAMSLRAAMAAVGILLLGAAMASWRFRVWLTPDELSPAGSVDQ